MFFKTITSIFRLKTIWWDSYDLGQCIFNLSKLRLRFSTVLSFSNFLAHLKHFSTESTVIYLSLASNQFYTEQLVWLVLVYCMNKPNISGPVKLKSKRTRYAC